MIDAAEAALIGIVERVEAAGALADETTKLARTIAQGPPLAIAGIKRALAASRTNTLRAQVELESEHQIEAFRSRDAAEGMEAFFEKRAAKFEGK
jgi:enoyl-CoA hydratase/carnithine racemase